MFETLDEILTVTEVAEVLKISTTQAYRLLRSNRINGFKEGKDWKIPRESVEKYILQRLNS